MFLHCTLHNIKVSVMWTGKKILSANGHCRDKRRNQDKEASLFFIPSLRPTIKLYDDTMAEQQQEALIWAASECCSVKTSQARSQLLEIPPMMTAWNSSTFMFPSFSATTWLVSELRWGSGDRGYNKEVWFRHHPRPVLACCKSTIGNKRWCWRRLTGWQSELFLLWEGPLTLFWRVIIHTMEQKMLTQKS